MNVVFLLVSYHIVDNCLSISKGFGSSLQTRFEVPLGCLFLLEDCGFMFIESYAIWSVIS